MKKLNRKGFTLIELLAVITIMGILMLVAIPAISRTIENSRRDTFADVALKYMDAVSTSVLADEIVCYPADANGKASGTSSSYGALEDGYYIFYLATISSKAEAVGTIAAGDIVQNTQDLLENGGKSSWGSTDVYGYVAWQKETQSNGQVKTHYSVLLQDSAHHGMVSEQMKKDVKRSNVSSNIPTGNYKSKISATKTVQNGKTVKYVCKLG